MVSLAISCIKYMLFLFSLLFAIIGAAVLVFGALLQSVYYNYSSFINENFMILPIFIIILGSLIFIVASFGCCGIIKENICMLSTFASLLITLIIMQIVTGAAAFIFNNDIRNIVTEKLNSTLQHYETDSIVSKTWDITQTDLHCCGVNEYNDWKDKIPSSCCSDIRLDEQCSAESAYKNGCLNVVISFFKNHFSIIAIIAATVTIIQLLGAVFACCLGHYL